MINGRLVDFVQRDQAARILVVTNMWPDEDWPVYGIFVQRQVESLRSEDLACDVLYVRGYKSRLAYAVAAVQFLIWNLRPPARYRVMHVHAGETALVARLFLRARSVVTFHGDDIMGDRRDDGTVPPRSRVRALAIRIVGVLYRARIVQSDEMFRRIPRLVRGRTHVIPCGIDPALFKPLDRDSARRDLGYADDRPVVLFAAIKPDRALKRRWLAEAAVADATQRIGPIRLVVSGDTTPSSMPLLMNAADCLLHTSSFEGSPNVVREALMCNLPVVATESGDIRQLLDGVVPSRVCEPDPAALGEAVAECVARGRSNGRLLKAPVIASPPAAKRVADLYRNLAPALDAPSAT